MGTNIEVLLLECINTLNKFDKNPDNDQRAKAIVITKIEEALFWFSKVEK